MRVFKHFLISTLLVAFFFLLDVNAAYIDNGNGTVTDTSTGLMWQQSYFSSLSWFEAINTCDNWTFAGYIDWRLPSLEELLSLVDHSRIDPAIDITFFPNNPTHPTFWSSTTSNENPGFAWWVSFYDGTASASPNEGGKPTNRFVRAVRNAQLLLVHSPAGSTIWQIGNVMIIQWESFNITGNVNISISRQGGQEGTFETITQNTENDGQYEWIIAGVGSDNCVIRIEPIANPEKRALTSLFTINSPPNTPSSPEPMHQASDISVNASLSWSSSDPDAGDSLTFDLYFGTSSLPQLVLTNHNTTFFSPPPLRYGQTYHWRVVARDNHGAEIQGSIWSFATLPILPEDVDGNREIDFADVILTLQAITAHSALPFINRQADINGDENIGLAEAIYGLQCIARLRNNRAPVLEIIGDKNIDENKLLSFQVLATDPDGDTLTYSTSQLPEGATFDPQTRIFSWIPGFSQSGTYQVNINIQDDYGGLVSETITITVNDKVPILSEIGNKTINEGSTLSFDINAIFPDVNLLIFTTSSLPSGASFNANTKRFSWAPTYAQSGTYQVTFTVSDGYGGSDNETITITVNDKVPIFSAPDYYPLSIGDWQDFRCSSTGLIHRNAISGLRYIGETATKERTYWDGQKDYYTSDLNGVKLYGQYIISPNFTGDVYFSTPLILMLNNTQIGTTQVSISNYPLAISGHIYHVNITSTTTLLGLEDVQTENMVLKDCIKVSLRFDQYIVETGEVLSGDTVYYWFYKGIGCVKQVQGSDTYTITSSYINGIQQTY